MTLFGLIAYMNAVNHPFVHDDVLYIQHNSRISDFDIRDFFKEPLVEDSEFSKINQYYRPLLEYVNKGLFKIIKLNPQGFHFFNVMLHILNSFLVYLVIFGIAARNKGMALITALFFLLHPVQSEAVACISGVSNLLFAFFMLGSLHFYFSSQSAIGNRGSGRLYAASLILFAMAMLSKEQAVVLPFLILTHEMCFGGLSKKSIGSLKKIVGYIGLLAAYFILRKIMLGSTLSKFYGVKEEYFLTLLAIPRSILMYLGLILAPHDLHYYRSIDILQPFLWPMVALIVIIALAVILGLKTPKPHGQWMIFGMLWFGIALLPTSNIIPLVNEYSLILTAEHFLYLPMIGVVLFIMGCSYYFLKGRPQADRFATMFVLGALICFIFASMTIRQNRFWRGEIPLFERTLQFQSTFGRVRFLLGQAYARDSQFEKAIKEDQKALAIMEGYASNVGNAKIREFYDIFIRQIHHHLGVCYTFLERPDKSLPHFLRALEHQPDNILYNYSVGNAYLNLGKVKEAIGYFEAIAALNPEDLQAANYLAICYEQIGNWEKAEGNLEKIAEKSSSESAKNNYIHFLKRKQGALTPNP